MSASAVAVWPRPRKQRKHGENNRGLYIEVVRMRLDGSRSEMRPHADLAMSPIAQIDVGLARTNIARNFVPNARFCEGYTKPEEFPCLR